MLEKFGGHDWGRWDSVERVLYKNGDGLQFTPLQFEYKIYTDNKDDIKALTDHRMMECVIEIDTSEYVRPSDIALSEAKKPSFLQKFFRDAGMLLRFVWVSLLGILQLIFSNVYATIVFIAFIILLVYRRIKKALKQKRR